MSLSSATAHDDVVTNSRSKLYLAGIGVSHSVARPMHNAIGRSLSLPWSFENLECPSVQALMETFRKQDFAGGVVTMPYKKEIMPHLDALDDLAIHLGACNNVYLDADGKLRGTNTDWRGIKGCLLGAGNEGRGRPALIIGAGGAARAAVYALFKHLNCHIIYLINRDATEVEELQKDVQAYSTTNELAINVIHITHAPQVDALEPPYYVVGTVPDFEPISVEELSARASLEAFLEKGGEGVMLDMCYKPRWTRHRKLAEHYGWTTVDGVEVIGHQIQEQWRLWTGGASVGKIPVDEALQILKEAADKSTVLN